MRAGFIGLGDQGLPMAQRIHESGIPLTVWARRPQSAAGLVERGVATAATPAALGSVCDVVGVCVFDAVGVREVLFGPAGLISGMAPGGVVAVHTTLAPDEVQGIAAEAAAAGIAVLDAPVSGGHASAGAGTLTVMVGGDPAVLEQVRPVLSTYAAEIVHLGGVGTGQQAKLLNNTLFTAQIVLADDAMRLGATLGLDPAGLARVLATSSSSCTASNIRLSLGSLSALAATQANPTLSKDVGLLARALAQLGPEDLVQVASRFVAAMQDAGRQDAGRRDAARQEAGRPAVDAG